MHQITCGKNPGRFVARKDPKARQPAKCPKCDLVVKDYFEFQSHLANHCLTKLKIYSKNSVQLFLDKNPGETEVRAYFVKIGILDQTTDKNGEKETPSAKDKQEPVQKEKTTESSDKDPLGQEDSELQIKTEELDIPLEDSHDQEHDEPAKEPVNEVIENNQVKKKKRPPMPALKALPTPQPSSPPKQPRLQIISASKLVAVACPNKNLHQLPPQLPQTPVPPATLLQDQVQGSGLQVKWNNPPCPYCMKAMKGEADLYEHPIYCNIMKTFELKQPCQFCRLHLPLSIRGMHEMICVSNKWSIPNTDNNHVAADVKCPECKQIVKAEFLPRHLCKCLRSLRKMIKAELEKPNTAWPYWRKPAFVPDYLSMAGLSGWVKLKD